MRVISGLAFLATGLSDAAALLVEKSKKTSVADPEPSLDNGISSDPIENKKNLRKKKRKEKLKASYDSVLSAFTNHKKDNDFSSSKITKPSKSTLDVGILLEVDDNDLLSSRKEKSTRHLNFQTQCTDYVDCENGNVVGDSSTTCYSACGDGDDCCGYTDFYGVKYNTCMGFTGKVCKDGSCGGIKACEGATIPYVIDSCNYLRACYQAGSGGSIEAITGSCNGMYACRQLGFAGTVGAVTGSCNEWWACRSLGSGGGEVGAVTDSCNNMYACLQLGTGGTVGAINDSCNQYQACNRLGLNGGGINTSLLTCCNCESECNEVSDAASFPDECADAQQTVQCPTEMPSSQPSSQPSQAPSSQPSELPSISLSDHPSEAPSSQPSELPSLSPSDHPSEAPSSQPSELPSFSPSEHPSESPSCTPSTAPTEADTVYRYYADWSPGENGCKNDGNEPNYMSANPSNYLYSTLDKCCTTHFGWNYLACMGQLDPVCARSLWYPDWSGADEGCLDDGNEPQYMTDNPTPYMYANKMDCCERHYNWKYTECVGAKTYGGTGKYYPDFDSNDHVCRNDGLQPMYMEQSPQWWMHDDLKTCCTTNYSWNYDNCIGSDPNASPVANPDVDGKYFPDWIGTEHECKNDGTQPPYMTKNPSMWMYDTLDECCKARYMWKYDACRGVTSSSGTGSGNWFKNTSGYCRESNTGDGVAKRWDSTYPTKKACCQGAKWWDDDCEDE